MSMPLLSAPRKVGARVTFPIRAGDYLRGKIGAWVILDVEPADPRRSRHRYNRRLTIGRIDRALLPASETHIIDWVWDHSPKRRATA